MFSSRTPGDLNPNRLTAILQQRQRDGLPFIDLTQSNPTRAGFDYPADLLAPLAHPRGLAYRPQALGLPEAREAVVADYARRGIRVPADRIALTASTSEAYSLLFRILCDPGDEVLIPYPSYPLFEHLTRVDGIVPRPYLLEYHGRWSVNLPALEQAISPRTRVVLAVSPNNPTGSYLKHDELRAIEHLCARHGAALVVDEVFADYPLPGARNGAAGDVLAASEALVFSLGGLSKTIGLPQAKLGWIAVAGPPTLAAAALRRLEFVCDLYLSVSTPVQAAAAELLERGAQVRASIQTRVVANFRRLAEMSGATPSVTVLEAEGGWYGVLQVPTLATEEELVVELLTAHGILVHPGYFFDFPRESFLVVSLLTPPPDFADGVRAILRHFDCTVGGHARG